MSNAFSLLEQRRDLRGGGSVEAIGCHMLQAGLEARAQRSGHCTAESLTVVARSWAKSDDVQVGLN